jgi:hypothetical protein
MIARFHIRIAIALLSTFTTTKRTIQPQTRSQKVHTHTAYNCIHNRIHVHIQMVDVELDARNTGRWRRCVRVSLAGKGLPKGWTQSARIGLVARTSATASDNHDVLSLRVFDSATEAAVQDAEGQDGDDTEDDYMVSTVIVCACTHCMNYYACLYAVLPTPIAPVMNTKKAVLADPIV